MKSTDIQNSNSPAIVSNNVLAKVNLDVENFKQRILSNIDEVEIDFEVGYCYKRLFEDKLNGNDYWHQCYYFLKGLAHYYGIVCWC